MKIAHAVAAYYPHIGGVETVAQRLSHGCAEAGDQVTVLTHQLDDSPAEEWMGPVRVLRFPLTLTANNYPVSIGLFRHLKGHAADYDLVHAHSYHTLVGQAAVGSRLPFVFTPHYHGTGHTPFRAMLHQIYRPVGARQFAASDAIICVSEAERGHVVRDFRSANGKIKVIPNGTDRRARVTGPPSDKLNGPLVLIVGRLERYKNVALAIEAFRSLPSAATLVIVGDGPERPTLEHLTRSTEPGWPVQFTGRISDLELDSLLARADVVTSASDHEAFGLIVADGLMAGARVVASDIPAHQEIGQLAGQDAQLTLVDPRNIQLYTAALKAALVKGRASAGAVRLPSWAEVVEETRELYANVIKGNMVTPRILRSEPS
jgi:1,2-diacylglycerol 3-alpha-glucosyltransferase